MNIDEKLFSNAKQTEGFFDEEEAILLIETIRKLPEQVNLLEIGSYYGRSTLFMLSAMSRKQHLYSLDSFTKLAGYKYSNHSYCNLKSTIDDGRHTLLPIDILTAYPHIKDYKFGLVFLDGNHSYV